MARKFTIDRDRLDRFRADADAARGASARAADRVREAQDLVRQAETELRHVEGSLPGQPAAVYHRGEDGRLRGRADSQHGRYIEDARSGVEAARQKLAAASKAQAEGAAAREHAVQLFARLETYARERNVT